MPTVIWRDQRPWGGFCSASDLLSIVLAKNDLRKRLELGIMPRFTFPSFYPFLYFIYMCQHSIT